jgi:hypothetical protein
MQLVPGAIAGQIAAAVADDTARPLYVSLLVLGLATLGCAVLARRGRSP